MARTIRTKIYKFAELSKEAQSKAIIDFINDCLLNGSDWPEDSVYMPAAIKMEKMQTPWFLGETLFFDYRTYVIEDIKANEYEFTKDGDRYP